MPEEFYSRVSAMRKYSALSILAFILIPALLYFLALSVVHMKFCVAAVFSLFMLIIIFFLLKAKNEVKKNAKNLSPYAIECHGISEEHIINVFSAFTVMQDAFAAFLKYQRISYRFLFIKNDVYNKQDTDRKKERANRIINKEYVKVEKQAVYKLKSIRINVQMYYDCSEDIARPLQSNAVQLLGRVEPIVNVFVDLKNELVIFPAVCDTLLWKEVKVYCSAISVFIEKLELLNENHM